MHKYAQATGALLAHRLGRIFEILGFTTWIVKGQNNGIDIKVYDYNGNIVIACEVLNWSPYTRLSKKRKRKIIRNLTQPEYSNARKVLIYTAMKDEAPLNDLWHIDIATLKIGKQVLPRYFHDFYAEKNQILDREIDSKYTTNLLATKLTTYIKALNLEANAQPIEIAIS